jgi:hypothetical protein
MFFRFLIVDFFCAQHAPEKKIGSNLSVSLLAKKEEKSH